MLALWLPDPYFASAPVQTPMPPRSVNSTATQTSQGWQWMMPNIAVGAFILAMVALARDVQWAEQTLRLHMQSDQEFLQELAREASDGQISGGKFQARATQYLAINPHLSNIAWVDADKIIRDAAPFETGYWNIGESLAPREQEQGFIAARNSGRPVYGNAYILSLIHISEPTRLGMIS